MLNYIWLSLIVIGLIFALVIDISDITTDKFRNGKEMQIILSCEDTFLATQKGNEFSCKIIISAQNLTKFYGFEFKNDLQQNAKVKVIDENSASIVIILDDSSPEIWKEHYRAQRNQEPILKGKIIFKDNTENLFKASLVLDPVKFIKMNSITNDGLVKYARTAVEISIGLIGLIAFWLGLMKIAEASGLIKKLASVLKPITVRLFPDVPPEHPAMGAMIMNISANILGLANAATPLGLKAMEELNKLNKKIGTATDAMCTFLVINTSNVQLIPATVIAIRAASGSANPTEILGPVIVATTISTITGVIAVKLLSRLKVFRKQYYEEETK